MKPTDVIKYLAEILNISTENPLILEDMMEELSSIADMNNLRGYIKQNFTKDRYNYLTGYQKYLAILNDYRREYQPKLNADEKCEVENYADKLFHRTCDCFDKVNWLVQTGNDLDSNEVKKEIYLTFKDRPKDIKVLERIGKKDVLLSYMSKKEILRDKINKIVEDFTLEKKYPQLAMKTKEQILLGKLG